MGVNLEALWQKQVTERVIFFEHGSAANGKQTVRFIFLLKNVFSHFSRVCQRQINTINQRSLLCCSSDFWRFNENWAHLVCTLTCTPVSFMNFNGRFSEILTGRVDTD